VEFQANPVCIFSACHGSRDVARHLFGVFGMTQNTWRIKFVSSGIIWRTEIPPKASKRKVIRVGC
jgi:hypothetical protein